MALKKVHFIKDRFIFDDYESGLYFDVHPVKKPAGDENDFNAAIDTINDSIPKQKGWKATLLLTDGQLYGLSEKYRLQFAAKSYLILYKSGFDGSKLPKNEFFELGSGGVVCNPTGAKDKWTYYTSYTADGLGYRFQRVSKEEVDAYKFSEPTAPSDEATESSDNTTETPDEQDVVNFDGYIHLACPHCGKKIF